ncbi:cupin domain-containing protein [Gordonia mangrovi]|uniref:cupin domain-containing protein n=1 Tax=Gordonia mangrovi TaxID=2665643 RepID=UPI0021AC55AD|nr:cupin domain-containing protein [Gordonia mangrovi]UVF80067.1 cupin domain-containing protein [Gordonia mangrovi]
MSDAPVVVDVESLVGYKISPDDTVTLAVLSGPTTSGSDTTVCLEIWEPLGAQPPNSHAESTETFVIVAGEGVAYSDEHERPVSAGTVIVLPKGSVHRIVNSSATDKMYAITVMERDGGFEDLILRGTPVTLAAEDREVVTRMPVS